MVRREVFTQSQMSPEIQAAIQQKAHQLRMDFIEIIQRSFKSGSNLRVRWERFYRVYRALRHYSGMADMNLAASVAYVFQGRERYWYNATRVIDQQGDRLLTSLALRKLFYTEMGYLYAFRKKVS